MAAVGWVVSEEVLSLTAAKVCASFDLDDSWPETYFSRPMLSPRSILAAALLAFACLTALGDDDVLAPRSGFLLLRNGELLDGEITRAGDFFVVTRGSGIEIRMNASEVEFYCRTLGEAYERKAAALRVGDKRSVLELAQWCLRHRLYSECDAQLAAAETLHNDQEKLDPMIELLRSRLQVVQEVPAPASSVAPLTLASVPIDAIETRMKQLPEGTIEKFTAVIQPVLLNRCGANQCHGPNSRNEYQLYRPPSGQLATRRFTQRNLYATLLQLDHARTLESPLLKKASEIHGDLPAPVFDKRTHGQLEELVSWALSVSTENGSAAPSEAVETASAAAPAAVKNVVSSEIKFDPRVQRAGGTSVENLIPATTAQKPATMARGPVQNPPALLDVPSDASQVAKRGDSAAGDLRAVSPSEVEHAAAHAEPESKPIVKKPTAAGDPFDPRVFNERFHGKK